MGVATPHAGAVISGGSQSPVNALNCKAVCLSDFEPYDPSASSWQSPGFNVSLAENCERKTSQINTIKLLTCLGYTLCGYTYF